MKTSKSINIEGELLSFDFPKVMGVINVTKNSFYSQSRVTTDKDLLERAGQLLNEGADILDIGGYSSRPGATEVPIAQEISLTSTAIKLIKKQFPKALISIDTFRHEVADAALTAGAVLVNDISAGALDPKMIDFIIAARAPYIAMHMRGNPGNMQELTHYNSIMNEIVLYFSRLIDRFTARGHMDIIIDPGFGFAKTADQNFEVLRKLAQLKILEKVILVGLSRKSMIYKTLDIDPSAALNGTSVLNTLALYNGADLLRVHDVLPAVEAIKLVSKTLN